MTAPARQPAPQPAARLRDMPLPQQAGILSNDPRFQSFAATRLGMPGKRLLPSAAAQYLREVCRVTSRTQIAPGTPAAAHFAALQTEFDAWTGRIPGQREG